MPYVKQRASYLLGILKYQLNDKIMSGQRSTGYPYCWKCSDYKEILSCPCLIVTLGPGGDRNVYCHPAKLERYQRMSIQLVSLVNYSPDN